MIHATRFVAGVALKNIGAGLVTVTLTQVEGGSRARAAARFMVDVQHASMGDGERVRFIDARGYPEALQLGQVVQWLSKHMSGGAVSVRINVTDATRLPAPWTPSRINAMASKFAAVDADALRDDAAAKVATVTSWADSGRRAAVLDAAARMGECAAFVEWVRGERAEWPGAGDDVIEPPPPPPAPAPEPPAPPPPPPLVSVDFGSVGDGSWTVPAGSLPAGAVMESVGGSAVVSAGALRAVRDATHNAQGGVTIQPVQVPAGGAQRITLTVRPPDAFGGAPDPLLWGKATLEGLGVLVYNFHGVPSVRVECGYSYLPVSLADWVPGTDIVAVVTFKDGVTTVSANGHAESDAAERWTTGDGQLLIEAWGDMEIKGVQVDNL